MSPEFRFVIKGDLSALGAGELLTKISETRGITSVDVQGFSVDSALDDTTPVFEGDIVRNARLEKGLKQTELGEMVGLSKSSISNMENKRTVRVENWNKVAEALGLPRREPLPRPRYRARA